MNEKELRRLSRRDLLEMLIEQSEELAETKNKLELLESQMQSKEIHLDRAGSIAEAALQINGVFEAAEAAGQQYLDNIKKLSERQEAVCAKLEQRSMETAKQRLMETKIACDKLEAETKVRCAEMTTKAKAETKAYWDELSRKLEAFYDSHQGLRELLAINTLGKQKNNE